MVPSRRENFKNKRPKSDLGTSIRGLGSKPPLPKASSDETWRLPPDETWYLGCNMACHLFQYLAQDQLFSNVFSLVRGAK